MGKTAGSNRHLVNIMSFWLESVPVVPGLDVSFAFFLLLLFRVTAFSLFSFFCTVKKITQNPKKSIAPCSLTYHFMD